MRSTLTIEDDLAGLLKQRSKELGKSFKEVVNQAIRKGLQVDDLPISKPTVVTRPHSFGTRPDLDWGRLNQLADELEIAAIEESTNKDSLKG